MKIQMSEALAHAKSLIELGCDPEEAVIDAHRAFELEDDAADLLGEMVEFWLTGTMYFNTI